MPCVAEHGMVVAQEKIAAQIGADVLQARRQCGRCRGRDRLCDGRDLSARRQYRRRRLHGDPFGRAQRGHRDRLSRDRAGRDHARYFPRARRQARQRQVAQFRARHRRARHRRRTGAGAGEIRLGQIHAGGIAEAGDRSGPRRHSSSPTTSPTRCRTGISGWRAGRRRRRSFPAPTARSLREGDTAGPDRSRGNAVGDCRTGTARILPGPGRGKTGEGDPRRRRHHDVGRSQILPGR